MRIRKEIKVGAVILIALGALYFGMNYLKGSQVFTDSDYYYAIYKDVGGLTPDSKVVLNGVKVGRVSSLKLLYDDDNTILVKMEILESRLQIPFSSIAVISNLDLLGTKGIRLDLADRGTFDEWHQNGDTLIGTTEKEIGTVIQEELKPIQAQIERLVIETRDVISVVNVTLESLNETVGTAKSAIVRIEHATVTIDTMVSQQNERIKVLLGNVNAIALNLRSNSENISNILANVATISDSLTRANYAAAIQNATNALQQVDSLISRINAGEGSLGMLLNDDKLYNSLQQAALEIDMLAEDIRVNPKRYFAPLGKKSKDPAPKKNRDANGQVIPK